jgi:hypothetical protein
MGQSMAMFTFYERIVKFGDRIQKAVQRKTQLVAHTSPLARSIQRTGGS